MARSLLCLALLGLAYAQDDEGRAVLLLHKKIYPTTGFSVNYPINVTLTVYNKGAHKPWWRRVPTRIAGSPRLPVRLRVARGSLACGWAFSRARARLPSDPCMLWHCLRAHRA